jgi:hypothetical protein
MYAPTPADTVDSVRLAYTFFKCCLTGFSLQMIEDVYTILHTKLFTYKPLPKFNNFNDVHISSYYN